MSRLGWVCLGSALGGGGRFLIAQGALRMLGSAFPYGTMIELVATVLLGLLAGVLGLATARSWVGA
jgi:fluoride ion exporter CrcB/FEX